MVVFGGSITDDIQLGDIHILDVPTMTWTKGSAPPVPLNRSNMACTVGGDNFIAWGGKHPHPSFITSGHDTPSSNFPYLEAVAEHTTNGDFDPLLL